MEHHLQLIQTSRQSETLFITDPGARPAQVIRESDQDGTRKALRGIFIRS